MGKRAPAGRLNAEQTKRLEEHFQRYVNAVVERGRVNWGRPPLDREQWERDREAAAAEQLAAAQALWAALYGEFGTPWRQS